MFIIQSADLSNIFRCDLEQNQTLGYHERKRSTLFLRFYKNTIPNDFSDVIEHNIGGDTKILLLRCTPFNSKVNNGDITFTRQNMNNQSFTNLQFKKLLKNSFHSIKKN